MAQKGAFADLYDFIDADSELDGIERLDVDGVARLMSENPGTQLFPAGNEMAVLNALVLYRLDEFCDSETGDGSFTSDEFLRAMELARDIPYSTDIDYNEQMLEESDEKEVSYGYGDVFVGIKESTDEQKQSYRKLVYSASGMGEYDTELYAIIEEEMQSFFSGARSAEETAAVIQDRAKLYLDEKN